MHNEVTPTKGYDLRQMWGDTKQAIDELLADIEADQWQLPVVAVGADASVLAVYGHLVDMAERLVDGESNVPAACGPGAFTGSAPSATSVDSVRDRWAAVAPRVGDFLTVESESGRGFIIDLVMHEHDLRMALGKLGRRDTTEIRYALVELGRNFSERVSDEGLPPLRVTVEQWGMVAGDGYAVECVVADRYEFVRGLSGRRSASEMDRWNWSSSVAPWLAAISETGAVRDTELQERDPRIPAHMRDREFVL